MLLGSDNTIGCPIYRHNPLYSYLYMYDIYSAAATTALKGGNDAFTCSRLHETGTGKPDIAVSISLSLSLLATITPVFVCIHSLSLSLTFSIGI